MIFCLLPFFLIAQIQFSQGIFKLDMETQQKIFKFIDKSRNELIPHLLDKYIAATPERFFLAKNYSDAYYICEYIPLPCFPYRVFDYSRFVGFTSPDELIISNLNQSSFTDKLVYEWIPRVIVEVRIVGHSIFKPIAFLIDSGASISYINEMDALDMGFKESDCRFYLKTGGLLKDEVNLCVVEVNFEYNGNDYSTFVQIGNNRTTNTNLLGRFKAFDYFKITIEAFKQMVNLEENVTPLEKNKIMRDEL